MQYAECVSIYLYLYESIGSKLQYVSYYYCSVLYEMIV